MKNILLGVQRLVMVSIIVQWWMTQYLPAAPIPKREVRAVWITTILGLDWPKTQDPSEQQQSLLDIVEKLSRANYNTIFFQVRGRGDAMYRSRYEPWSQQLTGVLGKDPGWDPLTFLLEEAHSRRMEVHAWFNTFLVKNGGDSPASTNPPHIMLRHPEWLHQIEGEWWLDPGIPSARQYVVNVALDIARRYDIDGIQFDFARYPGKPFPDDAYYRRSGEKVSRADWRRENITPFVREFHDSAVVLKPMLKLGSAPIGIYTNINGAKGLQGYSDLFQDSRRWLREGLEDYLAPQVYWSIGSKRNDPDFAALAEDWVRNSSGRHIYLGVGSYKSEVFAQLPSIIDTTRAFGAMGNGFFRYENVSQAPEVGGRYQWPANIPPMAWKDSVSPNPPKNIHAEHITDGVFRLNWKYPSLASDGDGAKYFDVYRSITKPVDINSAKNLLAIVSGRETQFLDTISHAAAPKYFYAVTSFDKGNNESIPAMEGIVMPEIVDLANLFAFSNTLGKNYPDPASSIVFIPYEIKEPYPVFVMILDGSNREVVSVVDAVQRPGRYIAAANVSKLKRGIYSYKIMAGNFSEARSFTVNN